MLKYSRKGPCLCECDADSTMVIWFTWRKTVPLTRMLISIVSRFICRCLSSLFKELWPFEHCKMYRNVLKNHFLKDQNSLENVSISLKLSWQMLLWILWNGQKIDSKLPSLTLDSNSRIFQKNFFNANSKSEIIFHFRPCVYLAYLRSYGHLKIVKCIGMY